MIPDQKNLVRLQITLGVSQLNLEQQINVEK